MPVINRKFRNYTTAEGGWGRRATRFERARDLAVDTVTTLGNAVLSVAVKPNPTTEQLIAQRRAALDRGNWERIPASTPLIKRVRKGRAVVMTAAAVAAYMFSGGHSTEAAPPPAPDRGGIVGTRPTPEVDTQPSFTDAQVVSLTAIYGEVQTLWQKRGIDPSRANVVMLSGNNASFLCTNGSTDTGHTIRPSDTSEYCSETKTIVLTPDSVNGWSASMGGDEQSEEEVVAHEYGHYIQDVTGDVATDRASEVPYERSANCYAGVVVEAFDPSHVQTIYTAIQHGVNDIWHGPADKMADAFLAGTQGQPCGAANFPVGAIAGS